MADWNEPTNASPYEDVIDGLKALAVDAATLFLDEPTNPVAGMIKLSRSPVVLQERDGTTWNDLALSVDGGGTGASTATSARSNLGLGTLATQDADDVAIAGGVVAGDGSGLTALNATNLASGTVPDARLPSTLPALDGSNLTSLNASSLSSGIVSQARKWAEVTIALTGVQDDLSFSDADFVRLNNSSLLTIRGLAAGVAGQRVTLVAVGTGAVELAHQDSGSTAADRLVNFATSGNTPLAATTGAATYEYDGASQRWRLVSHEQGAWMTPAFSAGDYSGNGSMTWTVDSGDVTTMKYRLSGRTLSVTIELGSTSVGGTPNVSLQRTIPGGFVSANQCRRPINVIDNGVAQFGTLVTTAAGTSMLFRCTAGNSTNWQVSTNTTSVLAGLELEVQ